MASTVTETPKRYRSIVEGFDLVKEYQRSGLTAGEFARQRSISRKSLNYWIGRATALAQAAGREPQGFVEVTPPPSQPALPPPAGPSPAGIEVRLGGGATIVVHVGFDEAVLRSIVRVLSC